MSRGADPKRKTDDPQPPPDAETHRSPQPPELAPTGANQQRAVTGESGVVDERRGGRRGTGHMRRNTTRRARAS